MYFLLIDDHQILHCVCNVLEFWWSMCWQFYFLVTSKFKLFYYFLFHSNHMNFIRSNRLRSTHCTTLKSYKEIKTSIQLQVLRKDWVYVMIYMALYKGLKSYDIFKLHYTRKISLINNWSNLINTNVMLRIFWNWYILAAPHKLAGCLVTGLTLP